MTRYFFYAAAFIDSISLLIAIGLVIFDFIKGKTDNTNSTMGIGIFLMTLVIGLAFYLKSIGKLSLANTLLWIPGLPILAVAILTLAFIILKPDMR
ncbi:MAG: hypothetical protein WAT92_00505 [Saprospiraceae bacterium]